MLDVECCRMPSHLREPDQLYFTFPTVVVAICVTGYFARNMRFSDHHHLVHRAIQPTTYSARLSIETILPLAHRHEPSTPG
jgi:hypothetical protein